MEPIHVLITGAAGQIGYVLSFRVANGDLFGERPVVLHLLEITPALQALQGVCMELSDCAFPTLAGIIATDKIEEAFTGVDVAFLVGAFPRKDGMNRSDLLEKNGGIFTVQGKALADFAKPDVKVLVVGNPANTNALIALHAASPKLGPKNFCAMTRLDHNRMIGELSSKLGVCPCSIKKAIVWGNHSNTQVPDVSHIMICKDGECKKATDLLEKTYYENEFITKVSTRGGAVIKMRGASSAASAANAALGHMKSWVFGTKEGDWVSMAIPVPENEPYGIKQGVIYSFPCTVKDGQITVVEGLEINEFVRGKMQVTEKELQDERKTAWEVLKL